MSMLPMRNARYRYKLDDTDGLIKYKILGSKDNILFTNKGEFPMGELHVSPERAIQLRIGQLEFRINELERMKRNAA